MRDDLVQLVTKVIREQQGCFFDDMARHVLAAVEAAGYVIVPREPTEAMIAAGRRDWPASPEYVWRDMIDAALKEDA